MLSAVGPLLPQMMPAPWSWPILSLPQMMPCDHDPESVHTTLLPQMMPLLQVVELPQMIPVPQDISLL